MHDAGRKSATGAIALSRRTLAATGLGIVAAASLPVTGSPASARAADVREALSPTDRADIQDLFTGFTWALDCGDEDEFIDLFAPDALIVGHGKRYAGRDGIVGWFRYLVDLRDRAGQDAWMHEAGQFRFVPQGKSCIVYAYATHFSANSEQGVRGVRSLGLFVCDCRRDAGGWTFHRFAIMPWDNAKVPWKKPLPWAEG